MIFVDLGTVLSAHTRVCPERSPETILRRLNGLPTVEDDDQLGSALKIQDSPSAALLSWICTTFGGSLELASRDLKIPGIDSGVSVCGCQTYPSTSCCLHGADASRVEVHCPIPRHKIAQPPQHIDERFRAFFYHQIWRRCVYGRRTRSHIRVRSGKGLRKPRGPGSHMEEWPFRKIYRS